MSQRTRWMIVIGVGVLLIALATWQVNQRAAGLEHVTNISNIDQLQNAFNSDVGTPRLILLLSPT
jgi:hypothetical protein